jgi:hypothetical protein
MAKTFRIPQKTVDRYLKGDNRHERMLGELFASLKDIDDVFQVHQMMGTMGFLLMELHGAKFITDQEYAYEKASLDALMTEAREVLGQNIR